MPLCLWKIIGVLLLVTGLFQFSHCLCFDEFRCWPPRPPSICRLPPQQGPCDGPIARYYYDYRSLSCYQFIYGGCQGNANNFKTLEECEARCTDFI